MKIKRVEIEGFRAYKNKADGTFDFTLDSGDPSDFIAIYAPNGFGKSSFYDAVEWAATNHLERLGGDYNKNNYEHAAKITKEDGVGQKILRNKDVSSDIPTRVTVSTTTTKSFDRDIKRIRSNSRDLRNDGKHRENEYFRKIILSQDEIDRFLREAKPQERYERFMKSFGGDAEIARKEISILINDNKAALVELGGQRDKLHDQLRLPVDTSVFDQFNQVASELNAAGEHVPLADENFTVNTEHELLSRLVTRVHELEIEREARGTSRASLIERMSRFPEIQLNLDLISEQQPRLSKLSKGVLDAQRYSGLLASHEKCEIELQATSERLEKLIEIDRLATDFFKIESDIQAAREQQGKISMQRAKDATLLEQLEQSAVQQKKDLAAADARALLLRNAVDNCGPIYSEIVMHQGRLAILNSQISEKTTALSLDKAQYSNIETELTRISALQLTSSSLLTADVSAINFDKLKIKELVECSDELAYWVRHDQTIQATQRSLREQMGLHERLITAGLEYLSLWPTKTCPLCNKMHESSEALKGQVKSTDLLSSLSRENADKLYSSGKRQNELREKIEALTRQALEVQSQRLADLRKNINELGERSSRAEREKAALLAEKQAVEAEIKALQNSVWDLTKEDLVLRAESEIRTLATKREIILAQQAELNDNIVNNRQSIAEQDSSLYAIRTYIDACTSASDYQKVSAFIKGNGLSFGELPAHCKLKKAELGMLKDKHRSDAQQLLEECKALYEIMLAEGTWVDFSALASEKEQVETQIAKSKSVVDAFIESVNRMIGSQSGKPLNEVKKSISQTIDDLTLQYKTFDEKITKINLLSELVKAFKPYLTNLSLQERLVDVERELINRNKVDAALNKERESVISRLKELVNNFFYEDLINSIYRKIDPHPSFKRVEFRPDFTSERPGLNIVVKDEAGNSISPILYFSAAQSNILSLSVFLANALHAKDDDGERVDVIMIDDPIQSMDSINVLATIDLLRSICLRFKKQIIISTHDENFFGLLQRKIPSEIFGSKFLKLEKFGVVVPTKPFAN